MKDSNPTKKINFNSGPAALPPEVLQQASEAVLNYNNTGLSILEIPHRGKDFDAILEDSKTLVKELCELNEDHEVLWMHGGGRLQFAMIPMNFLSEKDTAGYIDSGHWSADAMDSAGYYGNVKILSSSKNDNYTHLPDWPSQIPNRLSYLHITTNNTIYGTQLQEIPASPVPLIADMSSDIFSIKRDYTRYAMFYAVAQKNIGPAGVTLVVLNKKMLNAEKRKLPPMLSYAEHVKKNSVLNTPPVFAIYTSLLNLRWIKQKGIAQIEKDNRKKAEILYAELERNSLFHTVIKKEDRSMMNACFLPVDEETGNRFLTHCEAKGIVGIKGHRSVKGFRVSMYNAITIEDVKTFVNVMQEFEAGNI